MTPDAQDGPLIRPEAPGEDGDVRNVHALAFGDGERVPELVDALRAARAALPPVSLVAEFGGRVVGHTMLSACWLDALPRLVDVYSLSPLGVLPEHQRCGVGTRLIEHALAAADRQGAPLVFLEGSPRFYGQRGFRPAEELAAVAGRLPGSPALRLPGLDDRHVRLLGDVLGAGLRRTARAAADRVRRHDLTSDLAGARHRLTAGPSPPLPRIYHGGMYAIDVILPTRPDGHFRTSRLFRARSRSKRRPRGAIRLRRPPGISRRDRRRHDRGP